MSKRIAVAFLIGSLFLGAGSAFALQCVPYARDTSGISLRGDAWTWWSSAAGQYERGQAPTAGAVVVFKKHGSMRHGHVAVIKEVVTSREVLVDHANWGSRRIGGRGRVATNMAVIDVSPRNDWTQVRVWNRGSGDYGTRTYPTYGFIYPNGPRSSHIRMASAGGPSASSANQAPTFSVGDVMMAAVERDAMTAFAESQALAAPAPVQAAPAPAPKPVVAHEVAPAPVPVQAAPVPAPVQAASAPAPKPAAIVAVAPPVVVAAPVAPVAEPEWEGDLAAARKFGSGRY